VWDYAGEAGEPLPLAEGQSLATLLAAGALGGGRHFNLDGLLAAHTLPLLPLPSDRHLQQVGECVAV
jgi:hypothetical protein